MAPKVTGSTGAPTARYSTLRELSNSTNSLKYVCSCAKRAPVLLDEVEEDVDPLGRREVRVVLLVRAIGVSEAREHLDDAFHLRRTAHSHGKAQARFCRCKR